MASAFLLPLIFGAHVSILQSAGGGDFDGDGKPDTLYVVSTSGAPGKDVTVIDRLFGAPARGPQKLALAIVMGDGRKFLIEDGEAFATPIWSAKPLPLGIAKRKKHDVVVIGTEAGIDTTLYWNGKSFALFQPNEEP